MAECNFPRLRFGLCTALLTLSLVMLAGLPSALAAPVSYGDVEIGLESEPRGQPNHGYTEFRFWVRNRSTDRTRRVTLVMPANTISGRGGSSGIRAISRTIDVGPGRIGIVSLLQPSAPDVPGNGVSVYIDGRKQDDTIPLTPATGRSSGFAYGPRGRRYAIKSSMGPGSETLILLSQRVNEKLFNVAVVPGGPRFGGGIGAAPEPGMPPGMGGPGGMMGGVGGMGFWQPIQGQFIRADVGVSTWSERWLAYTRYDGITLAREDLEELQRGAQTGQAILQALWQYTEAGGTLLVLGPGPISLPPTWKRTPVLVDRCEIYSVGFGKCIVTPDRDSTKWSEERWGTIRQAFSQSGQPWRTSSGLMQLNQAFPVVDELGVPVRGLFVLMIVFALAIGPANLAILNRKKRRIWLLWTVPVLSLFFCGAVFGYMIIVEGWSGHARVAGFTLLDEQSKRATTLGKAAFYSPLTPGDGLRFTEDTEVQIPGEEHPVFTTSCAIDWTGEQHLSRGWVTARVPSHFLIRKSEALRRERMNLHKEADGSLSVTNALGVDVKTLWLADEKGRVYTAGPIAAGARVKLEQAGKKDVAPWEPNLLREAFTTDWVRTIDSTTRAPEKLLAPNTYLAVMESTPFLEQPLKGAKVRSSPSVVLGLMAAPANKQ